MNGEEDKRFWFIWRSSSGARHPFISAFFCFVRSFDIFVFVAASEMARAVFVLVQNSSQSLPLSQNEVCNIAEGLVCDWVFDRHGARRHDIS